MSTDVPGVEIAGPTVPGLERILTPEALAFLADLQRRFGPEREALLARRAERHARISAGERPAFLDETADIRAADWRVAPAPADLVDRRVEITGPAETEDDDQRAQLGRARCSWPTSRTRSRPTWANVIGGQAALAGRACAATLDFTSPEGKHYG